MDENKITRTPLIHRRILFFAAVFYTIGILIGVNIKAPVWLFILAAGVFLCLGIYLNQGRNLLSFCLGAMLCIGMMGARIAFTENYPPINLNENVVVVGKVSKISEKEDYCIYQLYQPEINGIQINGNIFLMSYTMDYVQDDILLAEAKIEIPQQELQAGGFNDYYYCRSQNVLYRAIANKDIKIDHQDGLLSSIHQLGRWVAGRLDKLFPSHQDLAKAFIIGDESDITDLQREELSLVGITHILSISGSHIAIIGGLLHLCFYRMKIDRRIPFFLSQIVVLFYTVLTGWKVSMVRAAWMYEIALWGRFLGKRNDPLTSMSAAYLGIIANNPAKIFDLGLQLSFGAVYAIICLTDVFEEKLIWITWRTARQTISAGIAATLGAFPITNNLTNYYWFPNLLANGIATLYSILMIPILLAIAAIYLIVGDFALVLGNIGAFLIEIFDCFTTWCVNFQSWGVYLPDLSSLVVIIWYICLFLCSGKIFFLKIRRKKIAFGLVCLFCLNLIFPNLRINTIQMRCFASQKTSVILLTEEGRQILLCGGEGEELIQCVLAEGCKADTYILAHTGKTGLEAALQLRQMGKAETIYADTSSMQILEQKYGLENIKTVPESIQLSPRMELRFIFSTQDYPMAALLLIDGQKFCLFIFEFMENIEDDIENIPILYYDNGLNSSLPDRLPHKLLIVAKQGEYFLYDGIINLYQNGETTFFFEESGEYRLECKYGGIGIY